MIFDSAENISTAGVK